MNGNAASEREFESRFTRTDGCWVWSGRTNRQHYGTLGERLAHRISYEFYVGPIPEGLCVLHRCDNPPCVNPKHLFLGTRADNAEDRDRKGRYVSATLGKPAWNRGLHDCGMKGKRHSPETIAVMRQKRFDFWRKKRSETFTRGLPVPQHKLSNTE